MTDEPTLLSLREAAELLRKRPADVQRLLAANELAGAYRESKRWRIPRSSLLAWQVRQSLRSRGLAP